MIPCQFKREKLKLLLRNCQSLGESYLPGESYENRQNLLNLTSTWCWPRVIFNLICEARVCNTFIGKRIVCNMTRFSCLTSAVNLRNIYHVHLCQVQMRLPTLALKPRGDVTRSPKQGYQWPQNGHVSIKECFQKNSACNKWNSMVKLFKS